MSVKRARINSVRPELPTPAPVRVVADQSRIAGVLRFYAALKIVEFHHAGHLDSYEADADAVYHRVVRAYMIVRSADRELFALISDFDRTANYPPVNEEVVAYRATVFGEIREFFPELIADLVDPQAMCDRVCNTFNTAMGEEAKAVRHITRLQRAYRLVMAANDWGMRSEDVAHRAAVIGEILEFMPKNYIDVLVAEREVDQREVWNRVITYYWRAVETLERRDHKDIHA